MSQIQSETGFAALNNARIYYEVAGKGRPLVMLHAGVADSRQWQNEFAHFANRMRVVRYDRRGYGKSEPVDGEFRHLQDLTALLAHLQLDPPFVLMGCSMGGGLAIDFALTYPSQVRGLILMGATPGGLKLDLPPLDIIEEAEKAYMADDLNLVAEIETQIWFDGMGRTPAQVNPAMRHLAYEMNRQALAYEAQELGMRLPDTQVPAVERLEALTMPVLLVVGAHDIPFMLAAADTMAGRIPNAHKVTIDDAAHLSNMDQPAEFRRLVTAFLEDDVTRRREGAKG